MAPRSLRRVNSVTFHFATSRFIPWQHRTLIYQFAKREILGRYRGSLLGIGWSFVTPLMMLAVYTFVFVGVFKARWPGAESAGGGEFALQIFAGLLAFNFFSEVLNRAPRLILDQPNLVKKVVFPLEILPWVSVLSGIFHLLLSTCVLVIGAFLVRGEISFSLIALPLVLLPFTLLLLGLSWLLAALGVFVRDIGQMMGLLLNLLMFLSPIFYSLNSLPPKMRFLMLANPMTLIIEEIRATVLAGLWPDWMALALYGFLSLGVAAVGAAFFGMTRKGFADVL